MLEHQVIIEIYAILCYNIYIILKIGGTSNVIGNKPIGYSYSC